MTISYCVLDANKNTKTIKIDDILRVEPGKRAVSFWKWDHINNHELMYVLSFDSGYFNIKVY